MKLLLTAPILVLLTAGANAHSVGISECHNDNTKIHFYKMNQNTLRAVIQHDKKKVQFISNSTDLAKSPVFKSADKGSMQSLSFELVGHGKANISFFNGIKQVESQLNCLYHRPSTQQSIQG